MTTPLRTRILLAEDHEMVRRGLRLVLEAEPDLEVAVEVADGLEAVRAGQTDDVDLAVLDLAMPGLTGVQAAAELTRRRPDLRILLLSIHDDVEYLFAALKAGAAGYVLKSAASRDLVEACRAAMRGESFLYPEAVRDLVRERLEDAGGDGADHVEVLTPRESQVVKLIAEGRTTEEIAAALTISPRTVERHRENILDKLGLRSRVDVTRYAIRRGLVEP